MGEMKRLTTQDIVDAIGINRMEVKALVAVLRRQEQEHAQGSRTEGRDPFLCGLDAGMANGCKNFADWLERWEAEHDERETT